jgi:FkbM family methyltransferase
MKLKHWFRYWLLADTTWHGQLSTIWPLLRGLPERQRVVVDVGANDGFYSSNSYPLIRRGWRALLIEPHPEAFAKAAALHARNKNVVAIKLACGDKREFVPLITPSGETPHALLDFASHAMSGNSSSDSDHPIAEKRIKVEVRTLEDILESQNVPMDFGLLSIDTETQDHRVVQGLNLDRFRPRVVITEKQPGDTVKFDLLRHHGYQLSAELCADTVWVGPDSR